MRNPHSLRVYPMALDLAVSIYETTSAFPRDERFGLTSQMRRAAVSVGSNISEGCGRRGNAELTNFLYYAHGSASELDFQLELAQRLKFGNADALSASAELNSTMKRMLSRLVLRTRA